MYKRVVVEKVAMEYFEDSLAANVWLDKYALKSGADEYLELSPDDTIKRIAGELFRIEERYDNPVSYEDIYDLLKNYFKFVPAGSALFGIGNDLTYSTLGNCFVIGSPEDSYGGIMKADQELVQLMKRRGGVGLDISTLRPEGSKVNNAASTSTGAVSFMERFSNSTREVAQEGRRGALMISMDIRHPDIEKFITAKDDLTKITGANISVKVTDEFMSSDKEEDKMLWNKLIHQAWKSAEPGVLFWDRIISESPADCYKDFQTISTNPCCFSEEYDHYVLTEDGYKDIKKVSNIDRVWNPESKNWVKTSGYFNSGFSEVFKVTLSNGEILHITGNHKLAKVAPRRVGTKMSYDNYILTELSELSKGDYIKVYKENIDISSTLGTYEEGLILGWLTGDGCLSYKSTDSMTPSMYLTFWEGEKDLPSKYEAIINDFNIPISTQNYTDGYENKRSTLCSSRLTKYFEDKYQWNVWKFKQNFNPYLYEVSKEFLLGYLQAYFSADGCIYKTVNKNTAIELGSIEYDRLIQIKNLLLLFNISSSVYLSSKEGTSTIRNKTYNTKNIYKLSITGSENITRFVDTIGFLNEQKITKSKEVVDFISTYTRAPKYNTYTKIADIESVGIHSVGCINVPEYNYFPVDGIISGNSELPLCEYDSCRLSALNLSAYINLPFTSEASFDRDRLYKDAKLAQRMMDNIIDLEQEKIRNIMDKIESDPQPLEVKLPELYLWNNIFYKLIQGRRTGLGVMGLADAIAAMGIDYDSEDAIRLSEDMVKTVALASYEESIILAYQREPFLDWSLRREKENPFIRRILNELPEGVKTLYENYGRRNIANLTIAPTGSISLLAKTSSGIEPVFALEYNRKRKVTANNPNKTIQDKSGDWWEEYKVYHHGYKMWEDISGYCFVPTKKGHFHRSPYWKNTAHDIDPQKKIDLQSVIQPWIDHSISVTYNLPESVSEKEVSDLYYLAWKKGLKGMTVYRDGSRDGVLTLKKKTTKFNKYDAPKRPRDLICDVHNIMAKGKPWKVLIGLLEDTPYEVFAVNGTIEKIPISRGILRKVSKGNYNLLSLSGEIIVENITNNMTQEEEAFTRTISWALRHGAKLEFGIEQLNKSQGDITSFAKAIARTLKKYVKDEDLIGEPCPDCGATMISEGGCWVCKNCGNNKCE